MTAGDVQNLAWLKAMAAFSIVGEVKTETLVKAIRRRGRIDDLFAHIVRLLKALVLSTACELREMKLAVNKHLISAMESQMLQDKKT